MTSPLKQRVLETADQLFYAEGVRAVGIDRIIEESGIAKASFYRFFESKDMLISEWIQMRDKAWLNWFVEAVDMLAPEPGGKPLAIFDALYARLRNPSFRGCAFINTIVELATADHPAVKAARLHKTSVQDLIRKYLDDAGYKSANELSLVLMQLMDGALVTALRESKPDAALRAKELATLLLDNQERKRTVTAKRKRAAGS